MATSRGPSPPRATIWFMVAWNVVIMTVLVVVIARQAAWALLPFFVVPPIALLAVILWRRRRSSSASLSASSPRGQLTGTVVTRAAEGSIGGDSAPHDIDEVFPASRRLRKGVGLRHVDGPRYYLWTIYREEILTALEAARFHVSWDAERELLQRYLDAQRRHVLGILEGLSDEQLRQPVLPSGWTCLGMVKHLALSDEHYWFRCIVGGEPLGFLPDVPDVPDVSGVASADWYVEADATPDDVFALYRDEIRRADEIIAATPLDMAPRQRDPAWDEWGGDFPDLRFIMLHMITETACHAGHLDAARELLDRRQWIVL